LADPFPCRYLNDNEMPFHSTYIAQRKQKEPFRVPPIIQVGKQDVPPIIQVRKNEMHSSSHPNMFLDYCSANCSMQLHIAKGEKWEPNNPAEN
jgi:hypothetical protein